MTRLHSLAGMLAPGRAASSSGRPCACRTTRPRARASSAAAGSCGPARRPWRTTAILFLDEAPEFGSALLQGLREPVEEGRVTIARAGSTVTWPARFQLVLAFNPCPCGNLGRSGRVCVCSPVGNPPVLAPHGRGAAGPCGHPGARGPGARDRHVRGRRRPTRGAASPSAWPRPPRCSDGATPAWGSPGTRGSPRGSWNGSARSTRRAGEALLEAAERFAISSRAFHAVLRIARTIADLGRVGRHHRQQHLLEAVGAPAVRGRRFPLGPGITPLLTNLNCRRRRGTGMISAENEAMKLYNRDQVFAIVAVVAVAALAVGAGVAVLRGGPPDGRRRPPRAAAGVAASSRPRRGLRWLREAIPVQYSAASAVVLADEQNNIDVYERVNKSVVYITTITLEYSYFFEAMPQEGTGSGVIIDTEGHVLTNYHVIKGADQLRITLSDGIGAGGEGDGLRPRERPRGGEVRPEGPGGRAGHLRLVDEPQGRAEGARHRQPVRPRPDADHRHHLGARPAARELARRTRSSARPSRPTRPSTRATRADRC